ncbi:MAG TPA: hypothetical protein VGQ62_14670 [Chloroflexota bacterium]|nr:hypothetical protein [Chloroflexota bacterium]
MSVAHRAWRRWQDAAGPWQGWGVCPALVAPGSEAITPQRPRGDIAARANALATDLAATLASSGATLVLADLAPSLGVSLAAQLYGRGLAHPLLVLPRWPYADAVLPLGELLYTLVELAPRAGASLHASHVCLVIDAERERAVPNRSKRAASADNRYRLVPYDLPDLAALRARDVQRIVRLAHS